MKKIIILLLLFGTTTLIGCRTKQNVIEVEKTHIVHDTAFYDRGSVVYKLQRDSVSEKEKTTILTKHDSVSGKDTVFCFREKWYTRYRTDHDTVRVVDCKYIVKRDSAISKEISKPPTPKTHSGLNLFIAVICVFLCVLILRYGKYRNL